MTANEVIGYVLVAFGLIIVGVCVAAYTKVVFSKAAGKRKKGAKEILEQVNALIRNWTDLLKLIPASFRHIFVLLPFGFILIAAGLYILIKKPI